LSMLEEKIPKHTTSFTDFLGKIYFTNNPDDSLKLKVEPIREVSLKEKNIAELEEAGKIFENVYKNKKEGEYWKVKSGIFAQKIDDEQDTTNIPKDTLKDTQQWVKYLSGRLRSYQNYPSMNDKDAWEFLYKTGRYNYKLAGGTQVDGEDVYIIDFTPRSGGMYTGRMYITAGTYALIRADYTYAPGKNGMDIHLLGIAYTETGFSGSICFERTGEYYELKYYSTREGTKVGVDRSLALVKKKERWLFDSKVQEFKMGLDILLDNEESLEYYVLDRKEIPEEEYRAFTQPEKMDVIYVDQFNDKLWEGYSIIEPVKRMKDYKKQNFDFDE
jgi:hypothetical protein